MNDVTDAELAAALTDLSDGVIVAAADGTIRYWNPAAERILGWSSEEALGQNLELIVPDRHRPAHTAGYAHVIDSGTSKYGTDTLRLRAQHKSGDRVAIEFTVTVMYDAAARPAGTMAIVRPGAQE